MQKWVNKSRDRYHEVLSETRVSAVENFTEVVAHRAAFGELSGQTSGVEHSPFKI
jgi:hypothetical protein